MPLRSFDRRLCRAEWAVRPPAPKPEPSPWHAAASAVALAYCRAREAALTAEDWQAAEAGDGIDALLQAIIDDSQRVYTEACRRWTAGATRYRREVLGQRGAPDVLKLDAPPLPPDVLEAGNAEVEHFARGIAAGVWPPSRVIASHGYEHESHRTYDRMKAGLSV